MPRINPDGQRNPAKIFLEWKGRQGNFSYYDKDKEVETPVGKLCFAPLLKLSCIRGYNSAFETGIISNEVKNLASDILTVKYQKGNQVIATGTYAEVKATAKAAGGNYCVSLYCAVFRGSTPDDTEIWNFQLTGSGRGWIFEFMKNHDVWQEGKAVRWEGQTVLDDSHSDTNFHFHVPVACMHDVPSEFEERAAALQQVVLEYYESYSQNGRAASAQAQESSSRAAEPMGDKPRPYSTPEHEPAPEPVDEKPELEYEDTIPF